MSASEGGATTTRRKSSDTVRPSFTGMCAQGSLTCCSRLEDNSRPNKGIDERRTSPIIGLKAFNNWIKTVLIAKFARSENDPPEKPKVRVLDMGCGKGGDLMKWEKAGTELYVGVGQSLSCLRP